MNDSESKEVNAVLPELTDSDLKRFWSRVDKSAGPDACWPWTGATYPNGYGNFWCAGRGWGAHRFACKIVNGPQPSNEMFACHKCDNKKCVNGSHMFWGTAQDNVDDKMNKGRHFVISGDEHYSRRNPELVARGDRHGSKTHPDKVVRGENHPWALHPEKIPRGSDRWQAKLTDEQVLEIRRLCAGGMLQKDIAAIYGVTRSLISMIKTRRIWDHLE